jgi:hypothetical protein
MTALSRQPNYQELSPMHRPECDLSAGSSAGNSAQSEIHADPWANINLTPEICGKAQRATTPDQLESIYRFRYEMLCEVHQKPHPEADHQRRRLTDDIDRQAFNAFLAGSKGIYAVSRLVRATHPLARERILAAGGAPFLHHFGPEAVAKVGRLCRIDNPAGALGVIATLQALMLAAVGGGMHVALFTTHPGNRSLFERIGCRYFGHSYQHAYLGNQIGMAVIVRDIEYLQRMHSPLTAAAATRQHLPEDARWFQNTFS